MLKSIADICFNRNQFGFSQLKQIGFNANHQTSLKRFTQPSHLFSKKNLKAIGVPISVRVINQIQSLFQTLPSPKWFVRLIAMNKSKSHNKSLVRTPRSARLRTAGRYTYGK